MCFGQYHVRGCPKCPMCPVCVRSVSGRVRLCPVVSVNVCYPSPGAPFSDIPSPSPIPSLHIASDLPEFLTPNASSSWEDRHLPVRRWTLTSTKCRTLGQKNGTLKSRTDMFSYPMRRGEGGGTGRSQGPLSRGPGRSQGPLSRGPGPRCLAGT